MQKFRLILLIIILFLILMSAACGTSYGYVEGKIIKISQTAHHLMVKFEGDYESIPFYWEQDKAIPFELNKYYRIKYKNGATSFNPGTLLEYEEIFPED